jgi:hypothetical protein
MKRYSAITLVVLVACLRFTATARAAPDENDVYVLTTPEPHWGGTCASLGKCSTGSSATDPR